MPRARKGAARTQARRRVLREARGYYGTKSRHKQQAKVALMRAGRNAWTHRRLRRRDMRSLWIARLTAACRMRDYRYSLFVGGLQRAGVLLNRKMLSELAIQDPKTFDVLVDMAKKHLAAKARAAYFHFLFAHTTAEHHARRFLFMHHVAQARHGHWRGANFTRFRGEIA